MRLAILSDIHGNLAALNAVLQDIHAHAPFDEIIAAGDLAWGGPRPRETIDRLIEIGAQGVMGNMDAYLLGASSPIPTREREMFPDDHPINLWTRAQLGELQFEYLRTLPFARRFEPNAHGRLLVVHANPQNLDDPMDKATPDETVRTLLHNANADVIAYGHIHVNGQHRLDDILLVNVSSAGMSADGDPTAAWDEFEWDAQTGKWSIIVHRVAYDIETTIRDLAVLGRPDSEKWAKRLRTARY